MDQDTLRGVTLANYAEKFGKRFRVTKEQSERLGKGVKARRKAFAEWKDIQTGNAPKPEIAKKPKKRKSAKSREIVVRIVFDENAEWDDEWELPVTADEGEIVVQEDDKFFGWLDELMTGPYSERKDKGGDLMRHICDKGLGEVITTLHFPKDVAEWENEPYVEEETSNSETPEQEESPK